MRIVRLICCVKWLSEKIMVEICLTSNDLILGVKGNAHPLPIYLRYAVPVALATDDEGVSRSDMTHEYFRAIQTYDFLGYKELKRMARMSLEHSFLAGSSLWASESRMVAACATIVPGKFLVRVTNFSMQTSVRSCSGSSKSSSLPSRRSFDFVAPPSWRPAGGRKPAQPAIRRRYKDDYEF